MTNVRAEAGTIQDEPGVFHCARKDKTHTHTHTHTQSDTEFQRDTTERISMAKSISKLKKEYCTITQSKKEVFMSSYLYKWASLLAQLVNNLSAMWETWV